MDSNPRKYPVLERVTYALAVPLVVVMWVVVIVLALGGIKFGWLYLVGGLPDAPPPSPQKIVVEGIDVGPHVIQVEKETSSTQPSSDQPIVVNNVVEIPEELLEVQERILDHTRETSLATLKALEELQQEIDRSPQEAKRVYFRNVLFQNPDGVPQVFEYIPDDDIVEQEGWVVQVMHNGKPVSYSPGSAIASARYRDRSEDGHVFIFRPGTEIVTQVQAEVPVGNVFHDPVAQYVYVAYRLQSGDYDVLTFDPEVAPVKFETRTQWVDVVREREISNSTITP